MKLPLGPVLGVGFGRAGGLVIKSTSHLIQHKEMNKKMKHLRNRESLVEQGFQQLEFQKETVNRGFANGLYESVLGQL